MLIDLAMSNIELHFGEMIVAVPDNENISSQPTRDCAKILANCLNRYDS